MAVNQAEHTVCPEIRTEHITPLRPPRTPAARRATCDATAVSALLSPGVMDNARDAPGGRRAAQRLRDSQPDWRRGNGRSLSRARLEIETRCRHQDSPRSLCA